MNRGRIRRNLFRCGTDPKSDALTALDLDEKESLDAALESGAGSLLRIDINACRDCIREGSDHIHIIPSLVDILL